jgi:hypothetical protein
MPEARPLPEPCAIKKSLLLVWQGSTEAYSRSLSEYVKRIGSMSSPQNDAFRREVELLRESSLTARNAFDGHVDEHGC